MDSVMGKGAMSKDKISSIKKGAKPPSISDAIQPSSNRLVQVFSRLDSVKSPPCYQCIRQFGNLNPFYYIDN